MPPSPPPSPSQRSSTEPSSTEMDKRRSIYAELSTYIDDLKTQTRPGSGPQIDEDAQGSAVMLPDNFEEVVSCMTRNDLTGGGVTDLDIETMGGDGHTDGEGHETGPFTNGPPTDASVDWSKYALSDGISKLGVYYQYEKELKRDQSDRERIEKAMSKVKMLDRKIGIKEVEHEAKIEEFKQEIEELQGEVDRASEEYMGMHGVAPPGSKLRGSPDGKDRREREREGLTIPEADYYGEGPPSSRSSTSTRGGRVFLTDKMRGATPRSARKSQRGDLTSPAGSDVDGLKAPRTKAGEAKEGWDEEDDESGSSRRGRGKKAGEVGGVSIMERNKQLAALAGQTSLTMEEEARLKLLLGPDTEGEDDLSTKKKGNNNQENQDDDIDLQNPYFKEVFGGVDDSKRLREIDEKLEDIGALDNIIEDSGEHAVDESKAKGEGVLRARARARAEKEKEKTLDGALSAIKRAPLPLVGGEAGELSATVTEDDIKNIVDETNLDLLHEQTELADKTEIQVLLDQMKPDTDRQAEIRRAKVAAARKEINDVVQMSKLSDLAYEPKQFAGEIGEIYQAPKVLPDYEDTEYYDLQDGDRDGDGEEKESGESKDSEEKEEKEEKEDDDDKENTRRPTGGEEGGKGDGRSNDLSMLMMEMESAQAKAHLSLDRADAANREANRELAEMK
ncbi:hypothetical protein TrST_g3728 [Triparma strigata]|uniref:Fibrous sheath-interacting protein 1 n=1 Tax=Triparma strigata TaxID=1606541 RepID=A0A9W7EZI6_9STRA|nr:hypothetical protein TrST_g3728 [Triparma strigata]